MSLTTTADNNEKSIQRCSNQNASQHPHKVNKRRKLIHSKKHQMKMIVRILVELGAVTKHEEGDKGSFECNLCDKIYKYKCDSLICKLFNTSTHFEFKRKSVMLSYSFSAL